MAALPVAGQARPMARGARHQSERGVD
ncbi:hypothetical protein IL54_1859 [Sphingobium sp. ba1]|nr:hypothetical protein IL54_1859 [Sphingobium sp. ba1]